MGQLIKIQMDGRIWVYGETEYTDHIIKLDMAKEIAMVQQFI